MGPKLVPVLTPTVPVVSQSDIERGVLRRQASIAYVQHRVYMHCISLLTQVPRIVEDIS